MCRNIKRLRNEERIPTDTELYDASLQFIRKISGYRVPSRTNQAAFDNAVTEVASAAREMFSKLDSHGRSGTAKKNSLLPVVLRLKAEK